MTTHCSECGRTLEEHSLHYPGPYCVCGETFIAQQARLVGDQGAEIVKLRELAVWADSLLRRADVLTDGWQAARDYVPGGWRCAKCGFELTKSLLGVRTGNIAPDMAQHVEPCPNDGEPMERVTWKGDAMRLATRASEMMQRERALSEKFARRAKHCRWWVDQCRRLEMRGTAKYWEGRAEAWEVAALNLQQSNKPI